MNLVLFRSNSKGLSKSNISRFFINLYNLNFFF